MNNLLKSIERNAGYRWLVIVATAVGIISGFTQSNALAGMGSIFCVGMGMLLVVGLVTLVSIRAITKHTEELSAQLKQKREVPVESGQRQPQDRRIDARTPARFHPIETPLWRKGFVAGSVYGTILGLIILTLGQGDKTLGLFVGIVIAIFAGVLGIVPAYIGWRGSDLSQVTLTGAVVAGISALALVNLLSGSSTLGFWTGFAFAPAGAIAARYAYFSRRNGGD